MFWAEVYSRPDQKWIPVDPVRGTIKRKKDFEPSSDTGPIRMLYVVAFEEGELISALSGIMLSSVSRRPCARCHGPLCKELCRKDRQVESTRSEGQGRLVGAGYEDASTAL